MSSLDSIKHELVNQDTVFIGTALEIVTQLRDQAYFEKGLPLGSYLDALVHILEENVGVTIRLPEGDFEVRAEAFIQAMVKGGLFHEA